MTDLAVPGFSLVFALGSCDDGLGGRRWNPQSAGKPERLDGRQVTKT